MVNSPENWFLRHLHLTVVSGALLGFAVFLLAAILPVYLCRSLVETGGAYVLAIVSNRAAAGIVWGWVLRRKGRSLNWLVPVLVVPLGWLILLALSYKEPGTKQCPPKGKPERETETAQPRPSGRVHGEPSTFDPEINDAIDELFVTVGVREAVAVEELIEAVQDNRVDECISSIAQSMGLPISVRLSIVDSFPNDRPDKETTGSTRSTAARVSIPSYLPLFGTPELVGFPIEVQDLPGCQLRPLTFISSMAHELSHVLLHSLRHQKRNNEIFTDLTAMLMGYAAVMRMGHATGATITYGYPNADQLHFAHLKIAGLLDKYAEVDGECLEEIGRLVRIADLACSSYRSDLHRLKQLIGALDENLNTNMRTEDVPRIIQLHQAQYLDQAGVLVSSYEGDLSRIHAGTTILSTGRKCFHERRLTSLHQFRDRINGLIGSLDVSASSLRSDIEVVEQYVPRFCQKEGRVQA